MAKKLEKSPVGVPQSAQPEKIYKTSDPRTHYMELDALRGIAIIGVMMVHVAGRWNSVIQKPVNIPLLDVNLLDFFQLGGAGVTLFFLLSGYLLTWTESKRAGKGNYSLRSYALRRVFRLVPAYYIALALYLLHGSLLRARTPTLTDTFIYVTFLQNFFSIPHARQINAVFWSLTPEVMFYALLPLVILKIRSLYQRLTLFGVLVAVSLMIQIYTMNVGGLLSDPDATYAYALFGAAPLGHLWIFMAGVLLRMLVERLNEKRPGGHWSSLAFLLFVSSSVVFALSPYVPLLESLISWPIIRDYVVILFFAAALLGSPVLSRILAWQPLAFVGKISYSLFLLHVLVVLGVRFYVLPLFGTRLEQLDGAMVWVAFAAYAGGILILAGLISYLSYRYIESPFLRIKPK